MPALQLKLIGDVEVMRDGESLALPPSKKTRALLGYLALIGRPARRDHLCELLWELPDDPRGSLRWSLSKLRRLVDDSDHPRILANRSQVSFDVTDVAIDVSRLHALAAEGFEKVSTEELEQAAIDYRGNFLEGLDLTQLYNFYAWCVAEREQVVREQIQLLQTLVERLVDEPERAIPHARALVVRSPYDEEIRSNLIRLLVRSGRSDEAEQQMQMGERLLKEIGATPLGLLAAARHEAPSSPAGDTAPDPATAQNAGAAPVSTPSVVRDDPASARVLSVPSSSQANRRLVGRDTELRSIEAAYSRVVETSQARLILIQGEPGIGKSRLLESALELAQQNDAYLLEASAFESETIRPFSLWIDALRKLEPSGAREVFGSEDRGDRDQLLGGLTEIIARESSERPVVLLFDDLQWCDESSASALHYVTRMNRNRPVLGILAALEAELTDNSGVQQALRGLRRDRLVEDLRLAPLPDSAIDELIADLSGEGPPSISSKECRGNPLLAIELSRSNPTGDEGGSLHELVRERLSPLEMEEADLLRWAALLAPRIDIPGLVRVSGLDPDRVSSILENAEQLALLIPDERGFRFSHDLIARSIYSDISPARRSVMHGRVAKRLEQDAAVDLDRASDLAHHASLSGDPGLAARAMVFAGKLCLRFFANEEAFALAGRGLKWAEDLTDAERVCTTIELRDIALAAAPLVDWESVAKEYVALAEQALDYGALSHARLAYQMASYVRWAHGQWAHAHEETLQASRVARGGSDEENIIGMAETAKCLAMLERDLSRADAMLMEVQALASRSQVRHRSIQTAQGMLHFHRNELSEAEEQFLEARTLCKSAGERVDEYQAIEYLVMIDLERGRLDSARSRCSALVELGDKLREGSEKSFARALQCVCQGATEMDGDALEDALRELRLADAKHRFAYVLTRSALLDIDMDRTGQAIARAKEALDCAEALEHDTDRLLAHAALVHAFDSAGNPEDSARHRNAISKLDQASIARWALQRASGLVEASEQGDASRE